MEDMTLEQELQGFQVTDDNKADWCIEKIKEKNENFARVETLLIFKIQEYQEKLRKLTEEKDKEINFFTNKLEQYVSTLPEKAFKNTKTQSTYQLATGKIKIKRQAPEFIKDDTKLLNWLKENKKEEFIQVKESPMWGELKKTIKVVGEVIVTEDGEVIYGVVAQERPNKIEVECD